MFTNTCLFCERTYESTTWSKYCNPICRAYASNVAAGRYTKVYALQLHAVRGTKRACEICGRKFKLIPRKPNQRYCSYQCGNKAQNAKDKLGKHLRSRYGITEEMYNRLLELQNGLCMLCRDKPDDRRLVVDHDHETGRVRGLLCHTCNLHLGWYEKWHEQAKHYLAQTHILGDVK